MATRTQNFTLTVLPSRTLLTAQDFTYLGYYSIPSGSLAASNYTLAITHRYVSGELRFLVNSYASGGPPNSSVLTLYEFRLPSGGFGTSLPSSNGNVTNVWAAADVWPTIYAIGDGWNCGMNWEDLGGGNGRLWMTQGISYPTRFISNYPGSGYGQSVSSDWMTSSVSVCNLSSSGSGVVSNWQGYWGFQGVSQRCVLGRVIKNPSWFQSAYNVGPYMIGFGGYVSRVQIGGSLGMFALCTLDVADGTYAPLDYHDWTPDKLDGLGSDWTIPTSAFKIVASHTNSYGADWYASGSPTTTDRGIRLTPVKNYYDGGATFPINGNVSIALGSTALTFSVAQDPSIIIGTYLHCYNDTDGQRFLIASGSGTSYTLAVPYAGQQNQVNASRAEAGYPGNNVVSNDAVIAWYDSHDPYPNGNWLSPAPTESLSYGASEVHNRWPWGDTYTSSMDWIDGTSKYGIVGIASLSCGFAGYVNSHGYVSAQGVELHVFDPADLGQVAAGTRHPWNVQPRAMKDLAPDMNPLGLQKTGGGIQYSCATYDSTTKRLWVMVQGINGYNSVLLCYDVNC